MQLCWLRNDLRLSDNHALWHAREQGPVVVVCLLCPTTWQEHADAPIKMDFWLRNLASLSHDLQALNIPLRVLEVPDWQDAPEALLQLADEIGSNGLHFNDEYGIHEQQRDDAVAATFERAGRSCQRYTDQLLFEPGSLLTQAGSMFKVYSQFRRLAYRELHRSCPPCLPRIAAQDQAPCASDPVPTELADFRASDSQRALWPAGEAAAAERLSLFCEQIMADYDAQRDRPDVDGTSRLSAYLTGGVLSVRQCLHAALTCNQGEFDSGQAGAVSWINELLWREFYKHILVCYPRVSRHRAFRPEMDAVPWRNDPAGLQAWQHGKTGFPILDAAMRQLLATGWMHNRLRMLSAMFLTKNLLIDWREGERWFMQHLIDGDLAANNGGWQWSASTGTDAAPYFRIFNPLTQSERFDPQGDFIRQWLPELAGLTGKQIHQPIKADLFNAIDYPAAIVDLKQTRQRALETFKSLGDSA
ncbi:deoxyribodipyrimidine photo-lyase [Halopseudomonas salegens]|uniref:deoxyribodipyrimidine photo-lyase n=1 Tax=Halopseudomonas salegens TaxID=1434072 RepID=UPI001560ED93|nr:deoxyribodipyrimidine photo-lyase [Halopseudomonas salegens]